MNCNEPLHCGNSVTRNENTCDKIVFAVVFKLLECFELMLLVMCDLTGIR